MVDVFRWKVFDGTIPKTIYNQEWWNLRWGRRMLGISAVLMAWEPGEARPCVLLAVTRQKHTDWMHRASMVAARPRSDTGVSSEQASVSSVNWGPWQWLYLLCEWPGISHHEIN